MQYMKKRKLFQIQDEKMMHSRERGFSNVELSYIYKYV